MKKNSSKGGKKQTPDQFKKFNKRGPKKQTFTKDALDRPEQPERKEKAEKHANKGKTDDLLTRPAGLSRLNKYIANAGLCSRREADTLIAAGDIKINGKVVTELGTKVAPGDKVSYKGKPLSIEKLVYVLLNKPKDFITTTDDPENRRTVMELIKKAGDERIYPVGRLDRNTTGLLLFTNDGELTEKLAHPSYETKKIYKVDIDKPITEEDFEKIVAGVTLEDGKVEVDKISILEQDATSLGLEIHVGRNRIVRRIFEHLGYEVIRLDRVLYAGLDKVNLPRGKWRFLTEKEIIRLKRMK